MRCCFPCYYRNLKRAEEKVESLKEEIEDTKKLIETLSQKLKSMEGEATNLLNLYEKSQVRCILV